MIAVPALPPAPPAPAALVTMRPGASASALALRAERLWAGGRTYRVRLPGGATPRALRALRATSGVAAAEPDRARRRLAAPADPLLTSQPYLSQVAWTPGLAPRAPVPVAVLDTGIDPQAPGLGGRVDVALARSFVDESDALVDGQGHGTHVAAIVATVAGGPPERPVARIIPVKIADRTGQATTSSIVQGIRYALQRKARVINVSFGGSGFSPLEQEAIDEAARAGVLVVAAAGNTGGAGSARAYPGAYRHVLAVGAVGPDGRPVPTSTRGPQVALAAPGGDILSAAPAALGGYATRTGTSMAAGVATGAAARVLGARPRMDASQVREKLLLSAGSAPPGRRDLAVGAGVLNLRRALAGTVPQPDGPEPNDDPPQAATQGPLMPPRVLSALTRGRVEAWSDPRDDFLVSLRAGEEITVTLTGRGGDADLFVWRPGTPRFRPGPAFARRWVALGGVSPGPSEEITMVAGEAGDHAVEVRAVQGRTEYRLAVSRR